LSNGSGITPAELMLSGAMHWSKWLDPDHVSDWDICAKLLVLTYLTMPPDLENWRAFAPNTVQFEGKLGSLARISAAHCGLMAQTDPDPERRPRWQAVRAGFDPDRVRQIRTKGLLWLNDKGFLSSVGAEGSLSCTPTNGLVGILTMYAEKLRVHPK
jgi:hypothetical protein